MAPGGGFATHGHRDMEIVSIVLAGSLAHRDDLGNGSTIRPGDVQRMSAGTGIRHSEFNPSDAEPVHFLQIWVIPEAQGLAPGYEQRHFSPAEQENRFRLIASRDGRDGSLMVHQDVSIHSAHLLRDATVSVPTQPDRRYWLHVATGSVRLNGETLQAGDGMGWVSPEAPLRLEGDAPTSHLLLFDLQA